MRNRSALVREIGPWRGVLLIALLLALVATGSTAARERPITVFAAASTTDVLQRLGGRFERDGGAPVRFSFASSSLLARQIEEGAPADLFVSADEQWMDYLQQRSLIQTATRRDLLANVLVLVAPKGRGFPVTMKRGFDLPGAFRGRLAVGDPAHVPAGIMRRRLNHLQELRLGKMVRATRRHQQTPRPHQLDATQIDFFIAPDRPGQRIFRPGERRRIQNSQVVLRAVVTFPAKPVKRVFGDKPHPLGQRVSSRVRLGLIDRLAVDVDAHDVGRPVNRRHQRKSAGMAKGVKNL